MTRPVAGTASGQVVAWAWNPAERPPEAVRRRAAVHALDALGCALAAARRGAADPSIAVAHRTAGSGPSTLLDGTDPGPAEDAALANGLLVAALDLDDVHPRSDTHPTAVVLPAALAVAEQVEASGAELGAALAQGLELAARLGAAGHPGFRVVGVDPTPVAGLFGATLATARLRGLHAVAARHALGVAGAMAAGSSEHLRTPAGTRSLQVALAARHALVAADLAAAGATGPDTVWEGRWGTFATLADTVLDVEDLTGGLGERWELEQLVIRPSPCHPLVQAAVDAAVTLHDDGMGADEVQEVVARVHPEADGVVCTARHPGRPGAPDGSARPPSPDAARRSLAWCVAAALVDGAVDVGTFAPGCLGREDVGVVADRVRCEVADHAHDPPTAQPGHLRVVLRSGQELVAMAPAPFPRTPGPDVDRVVAKFVAACDDHPDAPAAADRVLDLDDTEDLRGLAAVLCALGRPPVRGPGR